MANNHSETESPDGFVKRVGRWTNDNSHVIARIPGAFSLFRTIYNKLYAVPDSDVQAAKALPRKRGGKIERILIISPQSWDTSRVEWAPATGSYFYEIWKSAIERYGPEAVSLHQVAPGDLDWKNKALRAVEDYKPSHILIQGEEDPNGDPYALTQFAAGLGKIWDGQLILLMYDSVYWWHIYKAENIARVYPQTSVHAIDRHPKELRKVLNISGPGVLPTSLETLRALEKSDAWINKPSDMSRLTFVGSLYPDRLKQLSKFERFGIDIDVNPHRRGRTDRPSYSEYSAAIGHSWATINLSRNHGMPSKHVKTRVLEAPLFGTVLFSDEKKMSSLMIPEDSFVYFKNKRQLAKKVKFFRENPAEFDALKARGHQKALEITNSIFWEVIESGVIAS